MIRILQQFILFGFLLALAHPLWATDPAPAQKVYNDVSPSIFTIYSVNENNEKKDALGSAVAVANHLLATNCHVALSGNFVVIEFNKKLILGKLYYYNQEKDMCLVEVSGANFQPVKIRPSNSVVIGEEVYAIGNPLGLDKTISKGIISNKQVDKNGSVVMLQTDAAISHGSSGGGLFDKDSHLIGITIGVKTEGSNIGFAIPTELISNVLQSTNTLGQSSVTAQQDLSNDTNSRASAEPVNTLTKMGVFGSNQIGLIKLNKSCMITIPGKDSSNKVVSLALWPLDNPAGLFIFAKASTADDAIKFLVDMSNTAKKEYINTKSFVYFNKKLIPLSLVSLNNTHYPVYIFANENKDITEDLIKLDNFIVQFSHLNQDTGMTTITFSLDGLTEALGESKKSCAAN